LHEFRLGEAALEEDVTVHFEHGHPQIESRLRISVGIDIDHDRIRGVKLEQFLRMLAEMTAASRIKHDFQA
jgi:hypothetical protein